MGDVDWIFPLGPVLLYFGDYSHQKLLSNLLQTVYFDQQVSPLLAEQSQKALVEVWMSDESFYYHIHHEFVEKANKLERLSTLMDENGQTVCLPETMTIGDYLFKIQLQAFLQGGIVEWPEIDHDDYLLRRLHNLRQGGDEGLSLTKVRAAIVGGQKRVKDQKESMALVKAEYDDLRREWETANRYQDEERLLQIEIKNLQEHEKILTEKIASTANLQKRLELLSQNPDYRELRQLHEEIIRLEERLQNIEANLTVISSETYVDWAVIEGSREECVEWACLQKNLVDIVAKAQARSKQIVETQNLLQTSGYEGLSENEDQLLQRAEEERDATQGKLNKLLVKKRGLNRLKYLYIQESTRLENMAVMSDVTEADNNKIAQKEKLIKLWQDSKVGSFLDRTFSKRLGVTSIDERLSSSLIKDYKRFHVTNYQEFTSKLKEFLDQQKRVERMKRQIERLQEKVSQESKLRRIVQSRNDILTHAFTAVQATDFSEWLNGWEDYRRKKRQLSLERNELQLELEQQSIVEKKLAVCVKLLRERLENWGIATEGREEAMAAVLQVAGQLQERDDAKREIASFTERFYGLLGDRNMEQLSKTLEPLAELEREKRLSNEERLAEMAAWYTEQMEIRQRLVALKQGLQSNRKFPSLSVLEKKIDVVKHRWMAYENLSNALDEVQDLLELSWQEWQRSHEKILSQEKQWIYDHCFSSAASKSIEGETVVKRDYFSYRMAVAQLAVGNNTELPLFFFGGKVMNKDQNFWRKVTEYLQKLSFSRQIIFCTTDSKLKEKLSRRGWSLLYYQKV